MTSADREDTTTLAAPPSLWRAPLLTFVLALAITASLALYLLRSIERSDAINFEHEVNRTTQAIQERVDLTLALLRGTAGLFAASDEVRREEFRAYIARLALREHYPGIQGIGFTRRVAAPALEAFVHEVRESGLPEFRVWPEHARDEYHSIVYLEPQDARNQAAMGYDMFTHPVRRAAMEAARDEAQARASGMVTLVQEIDKNKQAGVLIYVPVFRGGAMPPTVEQRRRELLGFVYSPLRVGDLLKGVRGSVGPMHIDYELYDGSEPKPNALMRNTSDQTGRQARFVAERRLDVAGRPWLLRYASRPEFELLSRLRFAGLLFGVPLASSLLLAGISWLQVRARRAALELAHAGLRNARLVDELREQDQRKNEFLAMLGHELRNPLAPIVTSVHALKKGVGTERAVRLHDIIERQARQLTHLVNDLLEASRISTGRIHIKPQTMWLDDALRSASEAMHPELQQRQQTLHVHRSGQAQPLQVDPTRLAQVLANLLHNASKFSPDGAAIELRVDEQDDSVTLQVIDPGRGIAPQALGRLFDLFVQADRPQDLQHGGLGIGLALVQRIVELHGGRVQAHSAGLGEGATFTVWLPRAAPGAGQAD